MPGDPDRIKERLDLVDVINGYVTLQKAGTANFRARCPFHQEKTPSFYVSKERQMWHCFGCGEGGDHFTFVQKIEGMEFGEALRLLAAKAGVELEGYRPEVENAKQRLLGVLDAAARYWSGLLWNEPVGAAARAYLLRRGVSREVAESFRLGYAPESWDATSAELARRGYRADEIAQAGLSIPRERGGGAYDRFRGRIMFPIANHHGHIVGFTGRILNPESTEAKYVNTPETVLYKKGAILYGFDRARDAIKKAGRAVLVEGNVDVIACHRIGMIEAVAVSGTALTDSQLALLARVTTTLVLAFDADAAGAAAAVKSVDMALAHGFTVRVARLPDGAGKDADECIAKNPDLWRRIVANAQTFMEDAFERIPRVMDLRTAEGKRDAGNALLREIAKLKDPLEQTHWIQQLASLVNVPEAILREQLRAREQETSRTSRAPASGSAEAAARAPEQPTDRSTKLAEEFLALLLAAPTELGYALTIIRPDMLPAGELRDLYTAMTIWYTGGQAPSGRALEDPLVRRLTLLGEQRLPDIPDAVLRDIARYVQLIRNDYLIRERLRLAALMAAAEGRSDSAEIANLSKRYQELLAQQV